MELRKDYVLDRWVIISEDRAKRKREFKQPEETHESGTCYFCPGNEKLTPKEISRVEKDGMWKIRVFPNKFPAVEKAGDPAIKTDNKFFTYSNPYGLHEIIVETPDHEKQLWDLEEDDIIETIKVYNERISKLSKDSEYVMLFKNHGAQGGTSLVHSHTQVMSYNKIPGLIEQEVSAVKTFDSCPFCSALNIEKRSYRRCFENNTFVAFTPYASRFNFEIWMMPKRHLNNPTEMNKEEISDMAGIMKQILNKLKELNFSYNFVFHYAPKAESLHFHVEFLPRLATWAGYELLSGETINSVSPESAAMFYRGEE